MTSFFLSPFSQTDQEAPAKPHQAANERLHGVVADGEEEDHRGDAGQAQRRDLQGAGEALEAPERRPAQPLCGGGRAAEDIAPEGVPGLQVQAEEEAEGGGRSLTDDNHSDQGGQEQDVGEAAKAAEEEAERRDEEEPEDLDEGHQEGRRHHH